MDNFSDFPSYDNMHNADESALRQMFANPGGRSALRVGERIYPCPTCQRPNSLTSADVKRGYQCDRCADAAEGIGDF